MAKKLFALANGFSFHAVVAAQAHQRNELEQLCSTWLKVMVKLDCDKVTLSWIPTMKESRVTLSFCIFETEISWIVQ